MTQLQHQRKPDDEIVKDGERIRVPMFMMDGSQRAISSLMTVTISPHTIGLTDEQKAAAEARQVAYDHRISNAWRGDKSDTPKRRLEDAWRSA